VKFICLLFSLYVVLLSANPCCVDRDCDGEHAVEKSQAKNSTPKEKDCHGCSPFFTCGSCVGFVAVKKVVFNIDFLVGSTVSGNAFYLQPDFQEIIFAVWQPPRLG